MSRASGVLLHPTSLPGPWGCGDLGPEARAFARWLGAARQRYWQMLPLGPVDGSGSPYNAPSAFAGSPALLSIDDLITDGLLDMDHPWVKALRAACADGDPARVDHGLIARRKVPLIRAAARALLARRSADPMVAAEFQAFERAEQAWLGDWARFAALTEAHPPGAFWEWAPGAVAEPSRVHEEVAIQVLFDRQWRALRAEAEACGVAIIGDLPIFVSADSADAWSHPELFLLGADGRPAEVAGVPPDAFSPTGQMWGMPLYDWAKNAEDGFAWWAQRLAALLRRVDLVRIDHFRGFEAAWHIPAGAEDARAGRWEPGPGAALFEALRDEVGALPVIAEDLGVITPPVEALRDGFGLPGMKILQFAFGGEPDHAYLPHTYPERCVVYPGTHDNQTAAGWWAEIGEEERLRVVACLGREVSEPAWDLWSIAARSRAELAVVAAQDLLGLGAHARLNTPGVANGNWAWRASEGALSGEIADRLAALTRETGRDEHLR